MSQYFLNCSQWFIEFGKISIGWFICYACVFYLCILNGCYCVIHQYFVFFLRLKFGRDCAMFHTTLTSHL